MRHRVLHQAEHAVEIHGDGAMPVRIGHRVDGQVPGRPDAVVCHQDVETPEARHRTLDEPAGRSGTRQVRGDGEAAVFTARAHHRCRFLLRLLVAEHDVRPRRDEHPHDGSADAARAARDERRTIGEGQGEHRGSLIFVDR